MTSHLKGAIDVLIMVFHLPGVKTGRRICVLVKCCISHIYGIFWKLFFFIDRDLSSHVHGARLVYVIDRTLISSIKGHLHHIVNF